MSSAPRAAFSGLPSQVLDVAIAYCLLLSLQGVFPPAATNFATKTSKVRSSDPRAYLGAPKPPNN